MALTWADNSANETGFVIKRASSDAGPWTDLGTVAANVTTYTDVIGNTNQPFFYQVTGVNTVGYAATPGFSTLTLTATSNIAAVQAPQPP